MAEVQGTVIGIGILLAAVVMFLGPFFGVADEAMTAAAVIFAATFVVLAILHLRYGRLDLAGAHTLAAAGWVLVLLGRSGLEVALGLLALFAGGGYIARVMLAAANEPPEPAPE